MANTNINKPFASSGTRTKWTWSFWFKRSKLGTDLTLSTTYLDSSNEDRLAFNGNDQIDWYSYQSGSYSNGGRLNTNRKFRDTNAWTHIVIRWDSNNSTADDRMKMWINGVEETSFANRSNPTSGRESLFNYGNNSQKWIIGSTNDVHYYEGCISHMHFCDNQLYQASDFGSQDATTGEWKINTSPSITMGTNGFTILKDGNTITDQSSNSNDWSLRGGTLTKTEDCPSNVFATMQFAGQSGSYTLTKGNLVCYGGNNNDWKKAFISTIGATSGKYYWEIRLNTCTSYNITGVCRSDKTWTNSSVYSNGGFNGVQSSTGAGGLGIYSQTNATMGGALYIGGTSVNLTANDIIMYALDLDNKKMWVGKNGVWANAGSGGGVGNPATGANPLWGTGEFTTGAHYLPASIIYYTNAHVYNFGNGYFETTQVSAGTNASGNGIFEYNVPAGFTAWSTKGLNL